MNASAAQIIETLKEISADDEALGHLMTGLGGWASTTFAQLAQSLDDLIAGPEGVANAGESLAVGQYNAAGLEIMGEMFCQTVHSVNRQGAEAEANANLPIIHSQISMCGAGASRCGWLGRCGGGTGP